MMIWLWLFLYLNIIVFPYHSHPLKIMMDFTKFWSKHSLKFLHPLHFRIINQTAIKLDLNQNSPNKYQINWWENYRNRNQKYIYSTHCSLPHMIPKNLNFLLIFFWFSQMEPSSINPYHPLFIRKDWIWFNCTKLYFMHLSFVWPIDTIPYLIT
jgi:hypothetical protein